MIDSTDPSDSQTIAVVDVETTGLSAYFDRICEIGIVRARGDEILETFQTLINPQRPISPGASRVNGLCDADVCAAPTFAEVAPQLLPMINKATLVCHNAPFDLGFLTAEFSRLGYSWQPDGVIDTLELARRHYNFYSNSLSAVAAQFGIENPDAHRALGDAWTTLHVLHQIQRRLASRNIPLDAQRLGSLPPPTHTNESEALPPLLQDALARNKPIYILYLDSKGDKTCRQITPLQALAANGEVYLVAFCHLREAERSFRLDRIIAFGQDRLDLD